MIKKIPASEFYSEINGLEMDGTCVSLPVQVIESRTKDMVRANYRKVKRLIKTHLPDLYDYLSLDFYNPYNCYRTNKHIIFVHSAIEYFLKIR